jgi:periplasmic protein TonB
MKSIVAILTLGFALGMCNLTRRVVNQNTNRSTNAESPSRPPTEIVTATPPAFPGVNQNSGTKKITAPISGGVLNGKATSLPQPVYPPIARAAHASGTVTVQVVVDEEGKVLTARAVSGHPLLQAAAVAAARQARFTPTKLSGQPVKVTGVIIYNFAAQ